MTEEQKQILAEYDKIKPADWFKDLVKWQPIQWQIWGSLVTDMSVGFGKYFKSFAANLKNYLMDESIYIVCGNKDDMILMFMHLCKNNLLPIADEGFKIFIIRGNKTFELVADIDLLQCRFEGTRESEIHFKIFCSISKDFVKHLFEAGLLFDTNSKEASLFKIFQKRLPQETFSNLNEEQNAAFLAGIMDGDGSAAVLVVCPQCKKRNTIRSERFNCDKCGFDLKDKARSMDYNIMLDSGHYERLDEELRYLVNIGLKGHLYVLYVQKEAPNNLSREKFDSNKEKMERRILGYEKLTTELSLPMVIQRHILKSNLPSYNYAPDVYGSIKFLFTPHFRKQEEKIKWYGVKDIHAINLKIFKKSLKYMFINKKRVVLTQVIKNRAI